MGVNMEPSKNSSHISKSGEDVDGGAATAPPAPSNGAAACPLCGRTFASRKAMYGHMRSHPECERRGSSLQATSPAEKPSNRNDDYPSGHAPSQWSWFKTGKRGSKGMVAPPNPVQSPDSQNSAAAIDEAQAVENNASGGEPKTKTLAMLLGTVDGKGEDASEGELSSDMSSNTINVGLKGTDLRRHCEQKDDELGAQTCSCECCRRWCSSSLQQKRKVEDSVVTGSRSYACSMCGESFSSFQALGGHTARHGKHCAKESIMGSGEGVGSTAGSSKATRRHLEPSSLEHRCNVCGKVYPTGQALGGHKRLHWEGLKRAPPPPPPPPPPPGAAASSAGDQQRAPSRVHGFDLNEPPREDDGEE